MLAHNGLAAPIVRFSRPDLSVALFAPNPKKCWPCNMHPFHICQSRFCGGTVNPFSMQYRKLAVALSGHNTSPGRPIFSLLHKMSIRCAISKEFPMNYYMKRGYIWDDTHRQKIRCWKWGIKVVGHRETERKRV